MQRFHDSRLIYKALGLTFAGAPAQHPEHALVNTRLD